ISQSKLTEIQQRYPAVKTFSAPDGQVKIPTGWLIEQCGFKGQLLHGIRIHDKNSLVLINESAASTKDLIATRDAIIHAVEERFGVTIEQEPLPIRI
ncbi:MAG TPA: UDP-N-acetylmuramate dehydrogenase, partial [Candidatus Saccharibacteria bacterium]|nr:UDP-N-acetylmuramate dehydrogenase [Candidatus Saccharibacteria bacterium]